MLPAFIQNDQTWWYVVLVVLYFCTFLMVSVFVLQNILIATVIEMHRDIEIRDIIARYLRKHLAFAAAFEVIYNVSLCFVFDVCRKNLMSFFCCRCRCWIFSLFLLQGPRFGRNKKAAESKYQK